MAGDNCFCDEIQFPSSSPLLSSPSPPLLLQVAAMSVMIHGVSNGRIGTTVERDLI